MKIVSKTRNYRMFKKRYAETDLYQEYRRSHERVKVMLDEHPDEYIEEPDVPPSAQDNLQKFISRHENTLKKVEKEYEEQQAINLAEETIPLQNNNDLDHSTSHINRPVATGPELPPVEPDYENTQSFYTETHVPATIARPEANFQLRYEQEFSQSLQSLNNPQNQTFSDLGQRQKISEKTPLQHKKVEEELDDIIRDALSNVSPNTNINDSDVDPELLGMIKNLLVRNNPPLSDSSYSINYQDDFWNVPDAASQSVKSQNPEQSVKQPEPDHLQEKSSKTLDQQVKNQQNPPMTPTSKLTVRRPEIAGQPGVFDPSFSTVDIDDDSSLALTKQEISLQVKNLLRESLEETQQETSKPNDLLELEKQLKEHIEKIKQSKQNN